MKNRTGILSTAAALVSTLTLAVAGCSSSTFSGSKTAIDYWMWDANQLPGYQQCAQDFMKENDDIDIRITQVGWDDYWTKLTAGFVADAGPDVFTDHVARYPEFQERGVLLPLDDVGPLKDLNPQEFMTGLADMWIGQDGKRYGVPKDYDTVAIMYDKNVLRDAGISEEELQNANWNPDDGGSFGKIIRHLTVDKNGKRGDEDGFDKTKIQTYGLAADPTLDYVGQTSWSPFALSTGWTHTDVPVWGTKFQYDDPRFQKTMQWYAGLTKEGILPAYGEFGEAFPAEQQLGAHRAALAIAGSWMINGYDRLKDIDLGIAPLPSGPSGHPATMYNGLGDSISKQTKNPREAARWVAYLGSDKCQNVIGRQGIVFPARPAGTQEAVKAFHDRGIDVTPFTDRVERKETSRYPLTVSGAALFAKARPYFDAVWIGSKDPSTFTEMNQQMNRILKR
ncbi:ABC transporter substrate-binding protein [Gleimia hominis]|uniref:ABC transporter substrate-binding protein n=1 Tax=Gleimia hominis TaxID=595468 RepID=UPI000C803811|nr:sugar ABC transporter substrate-binding protein [Gleimia hominis]WIK65213.1 sugar ABC transporter substrate-binding protein [Gleimia hominis]